jgi:hypothetical protein
VTSMWTGRRKSPIQIMLEMWPFCERGRERGERGRARDSNWNWMQDCGRQWEQPGSKLHRRVLLYCVAETRMLLAICPRCKLLVEQTVLFK